MACKIVPVASLDWPGADASSLKRAPVQCAGRSFLDYESRLRDRRGFLHYSSFAARNNADADDAATAAAAAAADEGKKKKDKAKPERDLFSLSEDELKEVSHYEILGGIPMHSSSERIKRAYRRMCLRYHPDKTGRGEEDYVFLAVKGAFDTLSDPTKRRSYDSTVDFDESIPKGTESEADFYKVYGPVFERNLRFASFNDPARAEEKEKEKQSGGGGKKKKGKKGGRRGSDAPNTDAEKDDTTWFLGIAATHIDIVHTFYDHWTHFDSWRDFTLKATEQTEHDVDMADSRDEKRWMAKEIDRKARKMKQEEVARLALLVERAMAADPRLKRERERVAEEKRKREEEKEKKKAEEEKMLKEQEAKEAKEKAERDATEKEAKAKAKVASQAGKKQMRKARQLLRKLVIAAYQIDDDDTWGSMEDMNDDVELLCEELDLEGLGKLSDALGGPAAAVSGAPTMAALPQVKDQANAASETKGLAQKAATAKRNEDREAMAKKEAAAKAASAAKPFTKEELAALVKAVKKYPPGGANRWGAIALFLNNLCKPDDPRTKEECIERYNAIPASASTSASGGGAAASGTGGGSAVASGPGGKGKSAKASSVIPSELEWTDEQDKLLQKALAKFSAKMEKNERWAAIAKSVPGKSKKDCVQRFKKIRVAVKAGKK